MQYMAFSIIFRTFSIKPSSKQDINDPMDETEDENLLFKPISEWVKQRFW